MKRIVDRCPRCGGAEPAVAKVAATITHWASDFPFPGLVVCRLTAANGTVHIFCDKPAVFDAHDQLRPDAQYPIDVKLDCQVVRSMPTSVEVKLLHGIADTIVVLPHQALIWECAACESLSPPPVLQ